MSKKIPDKIKIKVIRNWLNALSRTQIATNNQIAEGSVSNIIRAVETQIPDIDLLRGVAVELRSEGLDLITVAHSIRLRKMLDNLHLPEERVEKLLEYLPVYFYQNDDRDPEKFLIQLEFVYKIAKSLDVSIFDMPKEIEGLETEITDLKIEKSVLDEQIEQKRSQYKMIIKQAEDLGLFFSEYKFPK
jgi:prefoldin subunit 5